jgi:hypothetical protein
MSVIFQGAFLIRFKGKADKAALGILFNYLIVNAFRIFVPQMLYSTWDRWITPASTAIIYSILYFFVFEMSYIRALLTTTSHDEHLKEKRNITIKRGICIGLMLGVFWPTSLYLINYWQVEETFGYVMVFLRAIAILGSSLYSFPLCLSNLYFFTMRKKHFQDKLSFKVLIILFWVCFMWSTKLIHALAQGIVVSLQLILNTDRQNLYSHGLNFAYLFLIRTFAYVVDFLNMCTLIYLFYC